MHSAGLLTTLQDRGRPGLAHLGVPPSGAVDLPALELGNRLVGNEPHAAALETTLIGPKLSFSEATLVALTGAPTAHGSNAVLNVAAGETLDVGRCERGARTYVCVRGGFEAEAVLGSRSTDLLTGLGPAPVREGDVLELGASAHLPADASAATSEPSDALRVLAGPRDDWFSPGALELLCETSWTVSPSANRVGVRLDGPALTWARDEELQSEGLVTGALQVPSNGRPILLLNDHPTTGGYPVIAVVHSGDLPRAGQLRPGDTVRFRTSAA